MSNLLKDVIADAKAVKAIAIENAKLALEETFQREVTGMFQNKIKEELANEELEVSKADDTDKPVDTLASRVEDVPSADDSAPQGDVPVDGDDTEISDKDLEEILAKLEEELGAQEDATQAPVDVNVPPVPAAPADSAVPAPAGSSDPIANPAVPAASIPAVSCVPAAPAAPAAPTDPVAAVPAVPAAPTAPVTGDAAVTADKDDSLSEINLEELLKEIEAEEASADKCDAADVSTLQQENESLRKDLNEHVKVVEYLRGQINEINLLNAKLLYTNKIFKSFGLTNEQKLNIVDKFDLAHTLREVKITYTVLADQLNSGASTVKKSNTVAKSITEGLASKAVASTKPSGADVIDENTMASRFQKLAGIKK